MLFYKTSGDFRLKRLRRNKEKKKKTHSPCPQEMHKREIKTGITIKQIIFLNLIFRHILSPWNFKVFGEDL